jgi:CxxC motif-containing protein
LIPELEAVKGIAPNTPNFFVCGNAQGAHDLVDEVTQEGLRVGVMAAGACVRGDAAGADAHGSATGAPVSVLEDYAAYLNMHIEEPKGHMSDLVNFAGVGTGAADAADVTEGAASAIERESAKVADKIVACTVCPTGCIVRVNASGQMCGNACARGEAYVKEELAHPVRTFTSTVKIASEQAKCSARLLPVRASHDIPREKLKGMAHATKRIKVAPPVKIGQVVARDVAGTGADLIACASVR